MLIKNEFFTMRDYNKPILINYFLTIYGFYIALL